MSSRFYRTMWILFYPLFHLLYPLKVEGIENVSEEEAMVLCANHSDALDAILLGFALPRKTGLRVMAKQQLFEKPFLRWLITKLGAFPVDRGNADISAVRHSLQCLKDGFHLLVFPEGTRVKDGHPGEVKGGVAMIAVRAGVKMLPVFIGTNKKIFHKVRIVFGEPYEPVYTGRRGTAEEYQANADEIMKRVYDLGGVQ